MIFRNLATSVRNQDWFAFGIEFLIVVLGIFVGLQVTDWHEQRMLDADSKAFVREIQADVELALQSARNLLQRDEETYEAGIDFLDRMLAEKDIKEITDRDLSAIRSITYYTPPNIRQGSIALALSAEGATRVRSEAARAALVEFQRIIERSDIVADRILGRLERIEPVLNRYRAMHVGNPEGRHFEVRYDLEAMNQSQEFQFAFQNALMVHYNAVAFTKRTIEALEELQSSFAKILDSSN